MLLTGPRPTPATLACDMATVRRELARAPRARAQRLATCLDWMAAYGTALLMQQQAEAHAAFIADEERKLAADKGD